MHQRLRSVERSIGIFELNVSSHLHTNVSIMSLISSSHKYFKYICRGRNEHEQGIKRDKTTDILPRNHRTNICKNYLLLFKTNLTMKGAQQILLFLTFLLDKVPLFVPIFIINFTQVT